jgi:hypothetical protein
LDPLAVVWVWVSRVEPSRAEHEALGRLGADPATANRDVARSSILNHPLGVTHRPAHVRIVATEPRVSASGASVGNAVISNKGAQAMRNKVSLVCAALVIAVLAVFSASAGAAGYSHGPGNSWPAAFGTPGGSFSGCNPILLSSSGAGYGFINFDVPTGVTFAGLGLFGDWNLLSGSQSQGEPYLIVDFTDGTFVFVYSVEINGPGTDTYYSDNSSHNTYINRTAALASYGNKIVSDATLAVDNSDLTIQVNDVHNTACPVSAEELATTDHAYLCYSVGGDPYVALTQPFNQAQTLMDDGYWTPSALPGNVDGGTNIGGYHLVCAEPRRFGPGNAQFATTYVDHNGQPLSFSSASHTGFIGVYPLSG